MSSDSNEKQYRAAVMTSVGVLAEAFGRTATEATIAAYTIGLGGLTPQQVENATGKALRSCRFMPTPSELRELAGELRLTDRAEIAWASFERAVTREGGYRSVCFDDPAINATVTSLGGWRALCEMPATEFDSFVRQKFIKAYEANCRAGRGAGAMVGMFAQENAIGGHDQPQIVFVETGLASLPHLPLLTREQATRPRLGLSKGLLELKRV